MPARSFTRTDNKLALHSWFTPLLLSTALLLNTALLFSTLAFSAETQLSELITVIKINDDEAALNLIADTDLNQTETDGTTALMWAIHHDNLTLTAALLDAGADVEPVNDYGSSAILEAILTGNNEILQLLLQQGAATNWTNPEGETILMIAARSGNLDAATLLLDQGADINSQEQWGGQSALMWATAQQQIEMIELLINRGAEVNVKSKTRLWQRRITSEPRPKDMNKGGFTPLHYAARQGCLACARLLIEAGADIDATDPDRVTALNLAILNLHFDLAAYLIESGANVNKWDLFGRSPLYFAVDMNTLPIGGRQDIPTTDITTGLQLVSMLLERGANPKAQLKMRPPYRQAVFDRRSDHILSYGATALMRAAKASDDAVIKLLLEYGAVVDLPNWMGITPVMVAAGLGRTESPTRGTYQTQSESIATVRLLLAAGAQINTQALSIKGQWAALEDERPFFNDIPWDGQTALHGAAKLGWTDVVEFLVSVGAQMQVPDVNSKTALDLAYGHYAPAFLIPPPVPMVETIASLEQLCQSSTGCHLPEAVLTPSDN